jgi:carboxypeptidase PM20D1
MMRVLGAVLVLALVAAGGLGGWMATRAEALKAQGPAFANVELKPAPAIDGARAAERLGAAIRIPTISRTAGVVDDPAAFEAFRAFLETTYPAAHAAMTREIVAGHSLKFTWAGAATDLAPIALLAHQDVVPVEPGTEADWEAAPFSGAVQGGFVHGRGALDDKGSLIALMEAAEALAASGFQPQRTVIFAFGHDEEVQGSGAAAMAALLKSRGRKAQFVLDEGMMVVSDFPLTQGPVALIGVAEKGYMTVRITAKGEGGHSSMPPRETAAEILARALLAIDAKPFPGGLNDGPAGEMLRTLAPDLPFAARLAIANPWALSGVLEGQVSATPAGDAMVRTTVAPTILSGGTKENILPQEAYAIVNLRLHPRDSVDSALAHLRAAVATLPSVSVEIEGTPSQPSPVSEMTGESYALLVAAAQNVIPRGAPVAPMLVLGATDSRHFVDAAENVYRFQPVLISQAETASIHGTGERISVENLQRLCDFYAVLIATAAS